MPAASTHYIFAHELLEDIKSRIDFELDPRAFYYGTQGPDLYFFHRLFPFWPGKSLRQVGIDLHDLACPTDILESMRSYARKYPQKTKVLSYFYGFMCHYALDSTTHAYIYAVQYAMKAAKHPKWWDFTIHNKIEFNIDTILIQQKLGFSDATKFPIYDTFSQEEDCVAAVAEGLTYISEDVLGIDLEVQNVAKACKDTRTLCKLTTENFPGKRKLIQAVELVARPFLGPAGSMFMRPKMPRTDWDYLNEQHTPWKNPFEENGAEHTEGFMDLYEQGKEKALRMVEGFQKSVVDGSDMTALTGNIGFSNGLVVPSKRIKSS